MCSLCCSKPLVCLFPAAFKHDLLCFLHLLHPSLPQEKVLALLRCLSQDTDKNPWVCALISQLYKDIGVEEFTRDTLLTSECELSLKDLCDRFKDSQEKGGWDLCLNEHKNDKLSPKYPTDVAHKKRKSEITDLDMDAMQVEEPQTKRRKTRSDLEDRQVSGVQEESDIKTAQLDKELEGHSSATPPVSEEDCPCVLPDHIKVK